MSETENKGVAVYNVVSICIAVVILTGIAQGVIMNANHDREVAELKQALQNELAVRTIEPIVWNLGTFHGKQEARDLCAKGATGELIPTRQGWGKLDCIDPDGNDFRVIGYWPDGKTLSARVTVPYGRVGSLAEYQRDPNKPNFAEWYIYKTGEKE